MKIVKRVTYSTFIIVLLILIINNTSVYADVLTGITLLDDEYDVEKVSKELFKDVEIRHSEYLYNYNVSAGTKYIIKVKLYTSTYTGRVKLGIAAYSNSISCYQDISGPYSPGYEYSSSTTSNSVTMLKLAAYTDSYHTIYTTKQENNNSFSDIYILLILHHLNYVNSMMIVDLIMVTHKYH